MGFSVTKGVTSSQGENVEKPMSTNCPSESIQEEYIATKYKGYALKKKEVGENGDLT